MDQVQQAIASNTDSDSENDHKAWDDSSSIIAELSLEGVLDQVRDADTHIDSATTESESIALIEPSFTFLPPNWPAHVKYLVDYEYHPSISKPILDLVQGKRRRPRDTLQDKICDGKSTENNACPPHQDSGSRTTDEQEYDEIPIGHAIPGLVFSADGTEATTNATTTGSPSSWRKKKKNRSLYEIRLISSPQTHPVLGSYGLFALRTLRPGLHLLDYISLVVPDEFADPDSDHTLYLSNDLNLDASVHGNHGRFVNDFRGIRTQEQGPNVGWDLYRDARTGQVRMGCKVLKRIQKNEEILCTYGKTYWKSRGIAVKGEEWEDGWDTDLEDVGSDTSGSSSGEESGEGDDDDGGDSGDVKTELDRKDDDTFRPPREQTAASPSPIQEP
ncbi:hypothetical protein BGZ83_008907 [Gryganskiella cystojenkinii]|nr:hypothetical protein BGZ83_008907 [Gryganskiella cystojenkinii]